MKAQCLPALTCGYLADSGKIERYCLAQKFFVFLCLSGSSMLLSKTHHARNLYRYELVSYATRKFISYSSLKYVAMSLCDITQHALQTCMCKSCPLLHSLSGCGQGELSHSI